MTEQILVKAARIYDARQDEDVEAKDLKTYAAFLSKEDAFTKVSMRRKFENTVPRSAARTAKLCTRVKMP